MSTTLPARNAIPVEYTWDAASVFATEAAWEAAVAEVETQIPQLTTFHGQLAEGPGRLADFFATVETTLRLVGKILTYATLCYSVDTTAAAGAAMRDRAQGVAARAGAAMAFGEPEVLALGAATLAEWVASEPRLAQFAHYFDRLERRKAHVRSAEVEALLRQIGEPFVAATATHGILTNADLVFAPAQNSEGLELAVAQGSINALVTHPDREVRRTAWEHYADAHLTYKHTMANCLASGVKQHVFFTRARQYASTLEAALKPNDIPVEVFHNLIATFKRHLPTWHRYWRLRRNALGYDSLHVYDCKAPLTNHSPVVPYAQAIEWICAGMQPLGDDYVAAMRRGLTEQRWVDVYPNQGKRAGAFSTGVPGTHPFIMLSYNNDIFSLSTLAHELGHSMHSYYTRGTQPYVYANYGLFVAEVASNFNQAMVRAHLLDITHDRDFQIAVIEEALSNFHRYFFIMPTLARFELEIHARAERGQALTAELLNDLMADLFAEGYGDEVALDRARVGSTWAQFSTHLYAYFYPYQYATGISGAHALAGRVLNDEPNAAADYRAFLQAGSSGYPLDLLRRAGVDLASPEPVERTFGVLDGLVERLEGLVG